VLDYHLHLWPHTQSDARTTVEQVAAYCDRAVGSGVTEIAVTEHCSVSPRPATCWVVLGRPPRRGPAAGYGRLLGPPRRVDLDDYVEVVEAVKAEGLPVVLGLEVDFYQDRMDQVPACWPAILRRPAGSVHWLGTWRFDVLDDRW